MCFHRARISLAILGVCVFWVFVVLVHSCSLSSCSLQKRLVLCGGKKKVSALMESTLNGLSNGSHSVVEDVNGVHGATEDQLVTPWTVSVARCQMWITFCLSCVANFVLATSRACLFIFLIVFTQNFCGGLVDLAFYIILYVF